VLPLSFFCQGEQRVGEMQVYGVKAKNNLREGREEESREKAVQNKNELTSEIFLLGKS
jgi:hypothetical protein